MSRANDMDPGEIPHYLLKLSQIEQICISSAHVQMQVYKARSLQFRYTRHCVAFMNNYVKFNNRVPLIPSELDVILLAPANSNKQIQRQFLNDFKVNQHKLFIWLAFLKQNHPDYRDITVDYELLKQHYPEDGDIYDQITRITETQKTTSPFVNENDNEPTASEQARVDEEVIDDDEVIQAPPDYSVIPHLAEDTPEMAAIRAAIEKTRTITAPSIKTQPLDEIGRTQRLFAMAFPTLFPYGLADFNNPCRRSISLQE